MCGMVQSLPSSLSILPLLYSRLSRSLSLLFLCSTNQQLCLEGNQAAQANLCCAGLPPPFLLPSPFYLTKLSSPLPAPPPPPRFLSLQTLVLCLPMTLSFLGTSPALDYSLRVRLLVELSPSCCLYPCNINQPSDGMKKTKTMCTLQRNP